MGNKWVEIKKRKKKQNKTKKSRREYFRCYQMQVKTMIKVSGFRICMSWSQMTPGGPFAKVWILIHPKLFCRFSKTAALGGLLQRAHLLTVSINDTLNGINEFIVLLYY